MTIEDKHDVKLQDITDRMLLQQVCVTLNDGNDWLEDLDIRRCDRPEDCRL